MSLPYVYMPGDPDSPSGMGSGVLITMDTTGCAFVKTVRGTWEDARYAGSDDPLDYTQRTISHLLKHGWVKGEAWDERGNPTRVVRTDKPGKVPY